MTTRRFLLLGFLLGLLGACERAGEPPVAPEISRPQLELARNTRAALFAEALRTAQGRAGGALSADALAAWEGRQAEVRAAHAARDPAAVQAKLQGLRAEELRFVVRVLGPGVVTRVLSESNVALAGVRIRLMDAARNGAHTGAAEAGAEEISQLLSSATTWATRDPVRALDIATEAAQLLAGIDGTIIELRRPRGVEALFPEAAARLKPDELRTHVRLQSAAHAALRAGDRRRATDALAATRAEEIRLILKANGNAASAQLISQADAAGSELRRALADIVAGGADATRRERMLATALDLLHQARTAERAGDHARALDLASHAAGLLNSLRHLLVQ